ATPHLLSLPTRRSSDLATIPSDAAPAERARASLRAVGAGYLRFALGETGLFRTAFSVPDDVEEDSDPAKAGNSGLNPFELLGARSEEHTSELQSRRDLV